MIDHGFERKARIYWFDLLVRRMLAPAANQRWSMRTALLGASSVTLPGWRG